MADMTEVQLLSLLNNAKEDAVVYSGNFTSEDEESFKYYMGERFGNEIDGKSSAISTDVADVVEADMPSLVRVFLGGSDIAIFEANTDDPKEIAEAEEKTKYINWIVRKQPGAFSSKGWGECFDRLIGYCLSFFYHKPFIAMHRLN